MVQGINEHSMPLAHTLVPGQEVDLAAVHWAAAREGKFTAEIERRGGGGRVRNGEGAGGRTGARFRV